MPNGSGTKVALSTAANPKIVKIKVHRNGSGEKKGTFTEPPPKLRVDPNEWIKWDLQVAPPDPPETFEIRFQGFSSPFKDAAGAPILTLNQASPALQAVNKALYHYAVKVTTATDEFKIEACPELDVSDN